ncbi:hypothetical protein [Acidithiobacillus thiooxidans]|uniref:hypothetical protein n=1 Tax=Acidithiobacillus thiooxidans TaxID=930 RepID=UPI0011129923|nr:hypothetical protein [Acidithiobacillus thiooxidans]
MREYDENEGLLLALNNYTYAFLKQNLFSYAWDYLAKNVWVHILMRPLQEKNNASSDLIFSVLAGIYNKKDLPYLYAYIEITYNSLAMFQDELPFQISAHLDSDFESGVNDILSRFNTGLTLCSGYIIEGLDIVARQGIETALEVTDPASKSIRTALNAISINGSQDADLCIREAACAVEYTIKERMNVNTLSDGTKKLIKENINNGGKNIHGVLLKSLERFYDYTSDTARHAATKQLTIEEAHLALGLSAAWVNFLRKFLPEKSEDGNP